MYQFWQQNVLLLSLEFFGFVILAAIAVWVFLALRKQLQSRGFSLKNILLQRPAIRAFRFFQYILGIAGVLTLALTVAPGLSPFKDRVDPNLELGGLLLLFIWPFTILQIIVGFRPATKIINKQPVMAWTMLIIGYVILLGIDQTALGLVYN
jgi:hypothetical protein